MILESLKAILIGIVEGITEWLPISSTGHMILVDEFVGLQVSPEFLSLFLVVIQIGAILAVIILYFNKLNPFASTKNHAQKNGTWRLWLMVVVGCVPAAVFGLLLDDWASATFYNKVTVAIMLILYGVIFIVLERRNKSKLLNIKDAGLSEESANKQLFKINEVDEIDWKTALKIGFFQVLAIIPGTSRSGATIVGGMLCGCSRKAAAEFTFFLAIPIMFGWGLLKSIKFLAGGLVMTQTEIAVLICGLVSAFVMSIVAIRFLMGYIKRHDFAVFGWYRIIVGLVVLGFFVLESTGVIA